MKGDAMKKLLLPALILLLTTMAMYSQPDAINRLYEKYAGEKGFVSIDLTDPEMLSSILGDKEDDEEVGQIAKEIQAMKILVYNGKGGTKGDEFKDDIKNIENITDFKTFISVNEEDSYVRIMTKKPAATKNADDKEEFLLLVVDKNESVMIWIKGNVNLKDIKKLGKVMKGM